MAFASDDYDYRENLLNCSYFCNFSTPISPDYIHFQLCCYRPDYGYCEAQGRVCRLNNNNSTKEQTECFDIPKHHIGRLSSDVLVAVKILNNFKGNGEEFINEVGSMGKIHHVNVTRLVGFCADGYDRALDITIGVAKGIEYLHQGCEQRILHFDIKPHNILRDHNFNPKISDFGLAKLCSKEQSAISMTKTRGTMGYIAPEVLSHNFGKVSYKSDVYSFGMLLVEMVGRRKNIDVTVENTSQVYFPEWAYDRLDKGEEFEIRIEDDAPTGITKKLMIVRLWCIQWYPVDRPSMTVVVQMLEGALDILTKPPNPFASTDPTKTMGATIPSVETKVIM
ncbi:hypothetical protein PVK06_010324 [Gossypium arboreum]|uniref:Protein kinase domain-containing protein n=1 Tax=Gossypium arboreum TaxID=29729 RepID=A0ABR0Q6M9_GOSAR|nr:hypothetical protein PVK06_010324 [Gossypium arboreum]